MASFRMPLSASHHHHQLTNKVSLVSIGNSIQAYTTLEYTSRVYSGPKTVPSSQTPKTVSAYPVSKLAPNSLATPLSSRTFGTWTLVQSIVRIYAAYNIDNRQIYQIAYWTYVVAFAHFMSEWFFYKTAKWGSPLAGPVIIATGSLVWMAVQYGFYVK